VSGILFLTGSADLYEWGEASTTAFIFRLAGIIYLIVAVMPAIMIYIQKEEN